MLSAISGRTFGPRCELEEPALLTRRTVSATVELGPPQGERRQLAGGEVL